jgi:hypothetical protein
MYAVILIFLGGIIVIFVYVTRLAGNEKFIVKPVFYFVLSGSFILINCAFLDLAPQDRKENFMSHLFITSSSFIL